MERHHLLTLAAVFFFVCWTVFGALATIDEPKRELTTMTDTVDAAVIDTTIDRLESYYELHDNLTKPVMNASTLAPVLPDGTMNLAVFPEFPDWDCTAYKGQGEYECNIDRCRAMMQVLNFTQLQTTALCGRDWRLSGEIKYEATR